MTAAPTIRFPAADGLLLEGRVRLPAAGVAHAGNAVLAHPDPRAGGNMDVWLLPLLAERLASEGWATLRFNFRGAGASEGVCGDGTAEVADLLGAFAYLDEAAGAAPRRALVGWSFGALVGLRLQGTQLALDDWVGIGPPTAPHPDFALPLPDLDALAGWPVRRTVIVGSHDQFWPPTTAAALHPHAVHVIPDADHFLFDRDPEVATLVVAALQR